LILTGWNFALRLLPQMSSSFKIFQRDAAGVVLLFCLGLSGTGDLRAQGRPIEFSEPTGPKASAGAYEPAIKSSNLPTLEDRALKPNSYSSPIGAPNEMKPLAPMSVNPNPRANNKNSRRLTASEEMMQNLIGRDVYKQPRPGGSTKDFGPGASADRYSMESRRNSLTNRLGAYDSRSGSAETNRWGDGLNAADAFATPSGSRMSPGGPLSSDLSIGRPSSLSDLFRTRDDQSPEAIRERRALANQLDEFKRLLDIPTVGGSSRPMNPGTRTTSVGGSGNSLGPRPGSSFSSVPEKVNSVFTPPTAPTAPGAPLSPDQMNAPPKPQPKPPKPTEQDIASPRRKF
jgi:hypothetical protein